MNNELLGHDAIVAEFLENSRDSLKFKTFQGDQTIDENGMVVHYDYLTEWEWKYARATAIAILNATISRICLEKETYDA